MSISCRRTQAAKQMYSFPKRMPLLLSEKIKITGYHHLARATNWMIPKGRKKYI